MSNVNLDETVLLDMPRGGTPLWAYIYPNTYKVGMANLGFHYIYATLQKRGVGVERFFLDIMERSVEGQRKLSEFPVITASVSFETDYINVLKILRYNKIPLYWRDRASINGPIVGIGGAVTYINPLLFSAIADFVCLGDGEVVIDHLVAFIRSYMHHGNKKKLWDDLSTSSSIYVPPIHNRAIISKNDNLNRKRGRVEDLSQSMGHSLWLTSKAAFGRTLLLELQRGCFRNCPYCVVPNNFGKARYRSAEDIASYIYRFKDYDDFNVGLVTPEAGDHPELDFILDVITKVKKKVSFASLRIDALSEKVVEAMAMGGKRSITIAPEAGSDNLRNSLKKRFTNKVIIEKLAMAKEYGISSIKMYFMLGLPDEKDDDVRAIAELTKEIWEQLKLKSTISISPFVPKPGTPFSDQPFVGIKEGQRRLKILKENLKGYGKVITLKSVDFKGSFKEYVLSWYGLTEAEMSIDVFEKNKDNSFLNLPLSREDQKEQSAILGF